MPYVLFLIRFLQETARKLSVMFPAGGGEHNIPDFRTLCRVHLFGVTRLPEWKMLSVCRYFIHLLFTARVPPASG